jgi:hypothetical protein
LLPTLISVPAKADDDSAAAVLTQIFDGEGEGVVGFNTIQQRTQLPPSQGRDNMFAWALRFLLFKMHKDHEGAPDNTCHSRYRKDYMNSLSTEDRRSGMSQNRKDALPVFLERIQFLWI